MGVFWLKMELGWRVEFVDKNEPEGVFWVGLNLWFEGVDGVLGDHCWAELYACRAVLGVCGVAAVVCVTVVFGG